MTALEWVGVAALVLGGFVYLSGVLALGIVVAHFELFDRDLPIMERLAVAAVMAAWPLIFLCWAGLTCAELVRRRLWWRV